MPYCDRYVACVTVCRVQPWCRCFVRSSSVKWTTAVLCWLVICSFTKPSPVRVECRCQAGFLSKEIRPLLCELHWLKVPERIKFRLCVLTHCCLHDMAPCYLAETIHPVSSCASRHHLRSVDISELFHDRRPCVPGGGSKLLSPFVRDAPSQVAFRR